MISFTLQPLLPLIWNLQRLPISPLEAVSSTRFSISVGVLRAQHTGSGKEQLLRRHFPETAEAVTLLTQWWPGKQWYLAFWFVYPQT
jgi:hypothetical protein